MERGDIRPPDHGDLRDGRRDGLRLARRMAAHLRHRAREQGGRREHATNPQGLDLGAASHRARPDDRRCGDHQVLPNSATMFGPAPSFHYGHRRPLGSYAVPAGAEASTRAAMTDSWASDAALYRGQVLRGPSCTSATAISRRRTLVPELASLRLMVTGWNHLAAHPGARRGRISGDVLGTDTYEPAWPAVGHIYNNTTWDCYDARQTRMDQNRRRHADVQLRGGRRLPMQVAEARATGTTPNGDLIIGLAANVRFVVAVESGQLTGSDAIAVRLSAERRRRPLPTCRSG